MSEVVCEMKLCWLSRVASCEHVTGVPADAGTGFNAADARIMPINVIPFSFIVSPL